MGWWRRNRWGLVGVIPAILLLFALSAEYLYEKTYKGKPRNPVPAGADSSFELSGTRLRLVDLGPATDLKAYDGKAFQPPPGVAIWRARIEFFIVVPKDPNEDLFPGLDPLPGETKPPVDPDAPPETKLGGCEIVLEDTQGRLYDDDPTDLLRGARDTSSGGCMADWDAPDPKHYVTTIYFALPPDAEPVAVRVNDLLSLPDYARLEPGRPVRVHAAGVDRDGAARLGDTGQLVGTA